MSKSYSQYLIDEPKPQNNSNAEIKFQTVETPQKIKPENNYNSDDYNDYGYDYQDNNSGDVDSIKTGINYNPPPFNHLGKSQAYWENQAKQMGEKPVVDDITPLIIDTAITSKVPFIKGFKNPLINKAVQGAGVGAVQTGLDYMNNKPTDLLMNIGGGAVFNSVAGPVIKTAIKPIANIARKIPSASMNGLEKGFNYFDNVTDEMGGRISELSFLKPARRLGQQIENDIEFAKNKIKDNSIVNNVLPYISRSSNLNTDFRKQVPLRSPQNKALVNNAKRNSGINYKSAETTRQEHQATYNNINPKSPFDDRETAINWLNNLSPDALKQDFIKKRAEKVTKLWGFDQNIPRRKSTYQDWANAVHNTEPDELGNIINPTNVSFDPKRVNVKNIEYISQFISDNHHISKKAKDIIQSDDSYNFDYEDGLYKFLMSLSDKDKEVLNLWEKHVNPKDVFGFFYDSVKQRAERFNRVQK